MLSMVSPEELMNNPLVFLFLALFSLTVSLVVYCVFPLIYAKLKKQEITKTKYKLICYVANFSLCIFLLFANIGITYIIPYIVWTCIFSDIGCSMLRKKRILIEAPRVDPFSLEPIEEEKPSTFTEEVQGLKPKRTYKTLSVVLAVALVLSVVSIFGLAENLNYTKDNLDYLSSNAVFVTETGNKYHRYYCDFLGARSYWIYNIELAESMGYEPCSECWPSYDSSNEESSHSYLGEIVNDEDIEKAKEIKGERYNYVDSDNSYNGSTSAKKSSDSFNTSFSGIKALKRAIDKSN